MFPKDNIFLQTELYNVDPTTWCMTLLYDKKLHINFKNVLYWSQQKSASHKDNENL